MDNAIAYQDKVHLSLGVALSAEQVAALTHDLVWLEEATVNGEKVLVPVLYLAQADNRLAPNGALIQGQNLSLISGGDLANQGTLRASGNLSASAANLSNAGLIEAAGRLDLLALDSIKNTQGGVIKGRDVSLTALTGDVISERSITRIDSSQGNHSWTQSFADNTARIEAAGNLDINAGRDIGNIGSVINAGRDLSMQAGRDINLHSVELQNGQTSGRNYHQSTTQLSGDISAGRDLDISAGRDLSAIATHIEAGRDIGISAGRDVVLASAADEQHSYDKTKKVTRQEDHVQQQSTTVTVGGDVLVSASNDLTLISSKVSAGNEAYLVAGDKIEVLAANDSDYSLYDKKDKGSWGKKETQRDEVTDVKAVGSEISAGSGITLLSGGDIAILSGGAVTFEAVKDLHHEAHDKSDSDLAWQSSSGKGQTDETVRQSQLIADGSIAIKAVDGLKIDYRHLDQQSVSQAIDAMVKADPNLAWLKDAEARGDVDWRAVQELHDSYSYSHSGMGQGTSLAVAIVVTYLTWGAGSAAMGVASTSATGVAANSVVAAVASNTAISTINHRGDLGEVAKDVTSNDSLKSYAAAGIGGAVGAQSLGLQLAVNSAMNTVLQGGSFKDNLGQAGIDMVADAVSGYLYNQVGNSLMGTGLPTKVAVHALVGGLIAEAAGGDFRTAALAAGANEAVLAAFGSEMFPGEAHDRALAMTSQLIGITVAAGAGGDSKAQEKAGWVAQQATIYNSLEHESAEKLLKEIKECRAAEGCSGEQIKGILTKYEEVSAERSNAITNCPDRACVDAIVNSSIKMSDPVSQELLSLLRQTTYDVPGLLNGNPDIVTWPTPNPDGWGDTFALDKQLAFAKNLREGWLTPQETADLDRWNASTAWVDQAAGKQFDPKQKAFILTELGTTAAMALLGGRGVAGSSKGTTSFGEIKTVLESAQAPYKGSTVIGHALSKHAGRNPEIWGKTTGSMSTWNDQAMKHLREITRAPGEFKPVTTDKGLTFMEKRLPDGRGVRLNMDGTFKGFID